MPPFDCLNRIYRAKMTLAWASRSVLYDSVCYTDCRCEDGDGGTGQPPLTNTLTLCDLPDSDEAILFFALCGQSVTIRSG